MKKTLILLITFILCLTASFGLTACEQPTREEIKVEWEDLPENTNPNLKYFGYFHSDGYASLPPFYDTIDSLKNTNIYMINSATTVEKMIEQLERTQSSGKKAILSMHLLLQTKIAGVGGWGWMHGREVELKPNAREIYANFIERINEYIQDGTLYSVYFDEPMWNGLPQEVFINMTKMMREVAPNVRIMNCMTVYDLGFAPFVRESDGAVYETTTAEVNQYVTDVMYDYYGDWKVDERQDLLNRIKAVATNNQRIWGCATGFMNGYAPKTDDGKFDTTELKKAIIGMYEEAINEPRYAGIISYTIASSDGNDPTFLGAYGTSAFTDPSHYYYDLSVKKLNINIGRLVTGQDKLDFSQEIEAGICLDNVKVQVGEMVKLPEIIATDGNGKKLLYDIKVFNPNGREIPFTEFLAVAEGEYTYVLMVTNGENTTTVSNVVEVY